MRGIGIVVLVAVAGCGKTGGDADTRPRHGSESSRLAGPAGEARGLDALSVNPGDAFVAVGCERRFPSPGTRYVEESESALVTPRGYETAYHDPGAMSGRARTAVTIEEASGAHVVRAHFVTQSWGTVFGVESGPSLDQETVVAVEGGEANELIDFADGLMQADNRTAFVVGASGFSAAVARGSVPALERAVGRFIGSEGAGGTDGRVHLGARRKSGGFATFDVEATWTEVSAGMSQFTNKEFTTNGTLVVREADGAFVELSLAGTGTTSSGINPAAYPGVPPPIVQHVTVRYKWSRPCFRTPVVG